MYIGSRAVVIIGTGLLNAKYAFYGFNDDLIKTIN